MSYAIEFHVYLQLFFAGIMEDNMYTLDFLYDCW
jgi:hypothetical protein